jgi:hypothetical protein
MLVQSRKNRSQTAASFAFEKKSNDRQKIKLHNKGVHIIAPCHQQRLNSAEEAAIMDEMASEVKIH